MSKNVRQNRKREPKVSQLDKQGWKSLLSVVIRVLVTCIIAAGIPYAAYMYYRHLVETDYFLPKTVTVHGNLRIDDQTILDASGLELDGVNLFEINLETVEGNIETLPWVKQAKVVVTLPDKVEIEITEHQPLGIVNDGQLYVVDNEGKPIKHWTIEDTLMAPVVSLDKPLADHPRIVVEAFQLSESAKRLGYPHKIQEIHYDDATGYTLYTDTSEIRLGYDRFDERIERLLIVDKILDERNVLADYILLDSDNALDRIVVRPKVPDPAQSEEPEKIEKTEKTENTGDAPQADTAKQGDDKKQANADKSKESKKADAPKGDDKKQAENAKKKADNSKDAVKTDKAPKAEQKKAAPAEEDGEPPEKLEEPPMKLPETDKAAMD